MSSPDIQPESDEEEEHECLLSEASRIIVSGSSTITGLDSTDASLILAAVLSLSEEDCATFLSLEQKEMVKGFQHLVQKKCRDDDHMNSPQHKRTRHH